MTDRGASETGGPKTRRADAPDSDAMRAQLVQARPAILRYLFGMGVGWDQAEDLAQEVLLKAWKKRASFDGRADARTWIFRIARNHWLDQLRKRHRRPKGDSMTPLELVIDSSPTPAAAAQQTEFAHAVRDALDKLGPKQREALALRETQGLTFRQIGELLAVPTDTAKSRVRSALLKLAEQLEAFAPDGRSSLESHE